MFGFLKEKLSKAIENISKKVVETKVAAAKVTKVITEKKISEEDIDEVLFELEVALLENNVAYDVSQKICTDIKNSLKNRSVKRGDVKKIIEDAFRNSVREILKPASVDIYSVIKSNKSKGKPTLIVFIGFNGAGKTTNLAKVGYILKKKGISCVIAAADTFRAAAIQQLEEHANNVGINIIKHNYGADSAAVIFDAMKHAEAKKIDVVLADTAGRTHQDKNLLEELKKIVRVNKPDIKLLVVESIAGNDVVKQAEVFNEVGVDGIVLSKWDIDQKGGAALSITHTIKKPIVFLGTGQNYEDIEDFDVNKVIKNII